MADPLLELHNSDGDTVDSNDNWMNSPDKQTFIDNGLAPTSAKESVVLGLLAPGAYTAIVRGANGGTGVGSHRGLQPAIGTSAISQSIKPAWIS